MLVSMLDRVQVLGLDQNTFVHTIHRLTAGVDFVSHAVGNALGITHELLDQIDEGIHVCDQRADVLDRPELLVTIAVNIASCGDGLFRRRSKPHYGLAGFGENLMEPRANTWLSSFAISLVESRSSVR
ncbi:hypothetical protein N5K55_04945 (plasmid) [Pseudomonas aeruginosa]|nr:hypothetical protein [Pseudomonas aeruginosa]